MRHLEKWKVKFSDNEDGIQIASFATKDDADKWIQSQENQGRYDPCGFQVIDGPCQSLDEQDITSQDSNSTCSQAEEFEPQKLVELANRNGICCASAEQTHGTSIKVNGRFPDRISLDYLVFNWHPFTDQYADKGWYQGLRCMNKWNAALINVLEQLYPNGILPKDHAMNESLPKKFDSKQYVKDFKDYFGYEDAYFPDSTYGDKADSIARECALRMPTDTEARETEGDAVMMLVLSGEEDAIEVGKKLGDCMMEKGKHDEETLLKRMSDAYKALTRLWSKREREDGQQLNESVLDTKLWIDDTRPAPRGYIWLKSVNNFIDYVVEHGLDRVLVIDIDHDAGDYYKDGGDYIKCLDYLESVGAKRLNIRVHSANPVGAQKMRQIIKKNGWREVHDIVDDNTTRQQQVEMLFESLGPDMQLANGEWIELDSSSLAYQTVTRSLKDGGFLTLNSVHSIEDGSYFIAMVSGSIGNDLDPQRWLKNLEVLSKFISQMLANGCGDIWLVDFNSDSDDGNFTARVGFVLLSSSANEDKKGIVDDLKKVRNEFKDAAPNTDPEKFADIVVALDDAAAAIGDYDFTEKRVLK